MNRKRIRQMNASLLRRLTTRPAVLWMEGRREVLAQLLEEQNYIQRFVPLYNGQRLRCTDILALCREDLCRLAPEPEEGWLLFTYDFARGTLFPSPEAKAKFDRFWRNLEIHRNNAFSLVAMETAFREGEEWLEQLKTYIDGNFRYVHDFLAEHIPQIKVRIPDATYLMWLDCRGLGLDHDALVKFFVEEAGLGLSDGRSYCPSLDGFMRLNAACSRRLLEKAMGQLAAAWKARE